MKTHIISISVILFLSLSLNSKAQTGKLFQPSFSLSAYYIPEPGEFFDGNGEYIYHEVGSIARIHVSLSKRLMAGLYIGNINNYSRPRGWDYHFLGGMELTWLLVKQPRFLVMPSTGFYVGNYCTCENTLPNGAEGPPIKKANSTYWGLALDFGIRLKREGKLFLKIGAHGLAYLKENATDYLPQPQIGLWWAPF